MTIAQDYAEAVIISGPRKGEFVRIPAGEFSLTPDEEQLFESIAEDATRLTESARAATLEAEGLLEDLRRARSS